ncbi:PAAR domain-containing protein [Candidatus Thiosymbion oneisti]|uniref:PAAR domain-containing protein n=1 Tax=Candidatus Thiosymbion oneisti TaxID=589554 RepID=UPI000A59A4D6|nr:PAAR domain-containing protein [Candidatus Thiosymbion oneisti]
MTQPAARVGDPHTCPVVDPGPKPHVGGLILPAGCPTVLIGGQPAARVGDQATCVGPPDTIVEGEPTVLIGGQPAARMGDATAHGGIIAAGCPTVLIGADHEAKCLAEGSEEGTSLVAKTS